MTCQGSYRRGLERQEKMQDFTIQRRALATFQGCFTTARITLRAVTATKQHVTANLVAQSWYFSGAGPRIGHTENFYNSLLLVLLESMRIVLLVTHQCSYLCHIIQTVENILSCFLWLNPRLCLMIIWCLLKTGHRHWPTLPCNQLQIMCHFPRVLHPDLIRDHCVSPAWLDTIYTISTTVMWHLLCHKVIHLFCFTSEGPTSCGGSLSPTLAWGAASHPTQKLTGLSPRDSMQPNILAQDTQGSPALPKVLIVELKCLPFSPSPPLQWVRY